MITEPQFILEEDKLKLMQNYTKSDILKKTIQLHWFLLKEVKSLLSINNLMKINKKQKNLEKKYLFSTQYLSNIDEFKKVFYQKR